LAVDKLADRPEFTGHQVILPMSRSGAGVAGVTHPHD
jgi:hypothetical protein